MAEQNRKTPEQRKLREAAEGIVDLFIDYLIVADVIKDVAWEGRNIMEMAMTFRGQPPKGSGFSGFCKLGSKVDRINRQHLTGAMKDAATLMALLSDLQVQALCVDRAMRGRERLVAVDPFHPDKPITKVWDDKECAHYLGCSAEAMRRRITDGYQKLESFMGREKVAA